MNVAPETNVNSVARGVKFVNIPVIAGKQPQLIKRASTPTAMLQYPYYAEAGVVYIWRSNWGRRSSVCGKEAYTWGDASIAAGYALITVLIWRAVSG